MSELFIFINVICLVFSVQNKTGKTLLKLFNFFMQRSFTNSEARSEAYRHLVSQEKNISFAFCTLVARDTSTIFIRDKKKIEINKSRSKWKILLDFIVEFMIK